MINFDISAAGIKKSEAEKTAGSLTRYIDSVKSKLNQGVYDIEESFIMLPDDLDSLRKTEEIFDSVSSEWLAGAVVMGIGGSSLGAIAIESAIGPERRTLFLETVDTLNFAKVMDSVKQALFEGRYYVYIVVSKSGTTTETIANFGALLGELRDTDKDFNEHVIVVTMKDSPLYKYAKKNKYPVAEIPAKVGGRFSVFSAVGMLPLMCSGVDIQSMLRGAREATSAALSIKNIYKNPALMLAVAGYLNLTKGRHIHNFFIFAPELESLGKFIRQMIGETLGKKGKGITPLVSIGTNDLHSVAQLYFGGPKDKFTTFIKADNPGVDFRIKRGSGVNSIVKGLENRNLSEIMSATYEGVKKSYKKHNMYYAEIVLPGVSAENLGFLMQLKMIEMVYLARLLRLNPFDQPDVEKYKEETRIILSKKL